MASAARERKDMDRRPAFPGRIGVPLVAAAGIVLSLLSAWGTHELRQEATRESFRKAAHDRIEDIRVRIAADVEVLRALGNLYATVPEISREVFHGFSLRSLAGRPSIRALEWIDVVPGAERPAFEAGMAREGHRGFAITERRRQGEMVPAAPRPIYYPIAHVEPDAGNEAAIGFDLGSEAASLATLEQARDTGRIAASPGITLVQEKGNETGLILFRPIYRHGMPFATLVERRAALTGFVAGVFRIADIVEAAAREREATDDFSGINLCIYDLSAPPPRQKLFSCGPAPDTPAPLLKAVHAAKKLEIGGRQWQIVATPMGGRLPRSFSPITFLVLAAGLTMTGLLAAYLMRAEAVRREKEKAETYLDLAGTIIMALDAEGCITLINRKGCEVLGRPALDLLGKDWFDLAIPKERRAGTRAVFSEIMAGDTSRYERVEGHEVMAVDGRRRRVDWQNVPLTDPRGKIVGILASGQDVTDRLDAEEETRRSLAILEVLASLLRLSLRTGSLHEFLGAALDLILGLPWLAVERKGCIFLSSGDGKSLRMTVQRGLEEGPAIACREVPLGRCLCGRAARERRILFCDHVDDRHETTFAGMPPHGHYCVPFGTGDGLLGLLNLYVREDHRPHRNEKDFLEAVADTLALIVERKHAEESRIESEERFRITAMAAQDAVVMVDSSARIVLWNPAAERIFGYRPEEILGRSVHEVITPPRYRERAHAGFAEFQRSGTGPVIGGLVPLTALRRDGTEFPIEIAINGMHGHDGWSAVAIVRDISHRALTEARLRQAEKAQALGSLASGIAHELNNLLLPIVALGEMIRTELPDDGRNRRRLDKVIEAARRAAEIVARIGSFTQTQEPRWEELGLRPLVAEALGVVRGTLPSGIAIRESLEEVGCVRGDPEQVQTIVINLASNAADAMAGQAGTLDVELSAIEMDAETAATIPGLRAGRFARLTFRDTGAGMDAETIARIFDPFFTTKEVGRGTGLGLPAVHGILIRHGGAITVVSRPGQGTTFEVYLPLLDSPDRETLE
jgi:PAS domain S-box-containing protein